jgi:predicted outer membrane repeat protein
VARFRAKQDKHTREQHVTFNSNKHRTGDGGAIFSQNSLIVNNSSFNTNSTGGRGGAIAATGGSIILNNCALAGNTSTGDGGGVYSTGPMAISASNFAGNASNGESGAGGGVASSNRVTVNSTVFSGNGAAGGGAINQRRLPRIDAQHLQFQHRPQRRRRRQDTQRLGFQPDQSSTFAGNAATNGSGGGLFLLGNEATMTGCTVAFNSAGSTGGGVALLSPMRGSRCRTRSSPPTAQAPGRTWTNRAAPRFPARTT